MTRPSWRDPVLCVVSDAADEAGALAERCAAAVAGGADLVQLRLPGAAAGRLLALAEALARACREHGALCTVNDRVDVAQAAGADGCHLPEHGLPVVAARRLLGPAALIGVSVHSVAAARAAAEQGADYLIFGHVFATSSKPGVPPRGLAALAEVAGAAGVPVLAIGGIDAGNVGRVLATGAAGAAVISAVMGAPDPAGAAAALKEAMVRGAG